MDFGTLAKSGAVGGGIMAGVFVVLGLLGLIPFVGCVTGILGCIGLFIPGILACYLHTGSQGPVSVGQGAIIGAISGVVAPLSMVITAPVQMLVGGAMYASQMGSMEGMMSGAMGAVIMAIAGPIIAMIFFVPINAGTGALYTLITNR